MLRHVKDVRPASLALYGSLWLVSFTNPLALEVSSEAGNLSISGLLWLSLACSVSPSGSVWLSLALSAPFWLTLARCPAHSGPLWLPLALSGALWLSITLRICLQSPFLALKALAQLLAALLGYMTFYRSGFNHG